MGSRGVRAVLLSAVVAVVAVGPWSPTGSGVSATSEVPVGRPPATWPYPGLGGVPLARLAAMGDFGTGGDAARATAAAADRLDDAHDFDAVLLLGDNVYPDGDPDEVGPKVLDPLGGLLDGGTRLVAALGNHDVVRDDGLGQLVALGMPARWYATRVGAVQVVVVDSTRPDDDAQLRWLDDTLTAAAAGATWTVVVQHHPPFSAGEHGSDRASRERFVPLYERRGVDLVLAGHDHDYQRIEPQGGVTYVVSGGSASLRPTGRADFTAAAASAYHFVELAAYADRLELRAVSQDGRVFDAHVLRH